MRCSRCGNNYISGDCITLVCPECDKKERDARRSQPVDSAHGSDSREDAGRTDGPAFTEVEERVQAVYIRRMCPCGGEFRAVMMPLHQCDRCSQTTRFLRSYPQTKSYKLKRLPSSPSHAQEQSHD